MNPLGSRESAKYIKGRCFLFTGTEKFQKTMLMRPGERAAPIFSHPVLFAEEFVGYLLVEYPLAIAACCSVAIQTPQQMLSVILY